MQIVVPVYNAMAALKKCVESLQKHNSTDSVVFINDASTDAGIKPFLVSLCESNHSWQYLENRQNSGFVKTANRGLQLTQGHTVLLNSDTQVSTGWLDGLKWAADHVENLGTATPWSNNAEICSFPVTLIDNPIPKALDQWAVELQQRHQATYPDLPTAVGFCMLITQRAKELVGLFDESRFGHGYGEENDYSLRVSAAELRNVLCDNVYVAHLGNQSFQEMDLNPNEETMARLLAKHPTYAKLVSDFIENDPLASLRDSIVAKIGPF